MPTTIVLSAYPGRCTPGGHELALSIGVAVPQRRVEVTDLVSVIEAVAAFGRDVQAANPAASFEVSTSVVAGRKPRGFDAADNVDAFGGRAFLRSDVDQSALHRRLAAEVVDTPDPTKSTVPAHHYRLAGDRRLAQGWKARARDNLAAIRLMTVIEAEGRHARPDEQEQLANSRPSAPRTSPTSSFAAPAKGLRPHGKISASSSRSWCRARISRNLKRATQYAHFTPEFMIRAIWRALRRTGFDGGRVLEPGCGTGLFFALAPEALEGKLALTGVEVEAVTARIAKLLYPNARIRHEDFTKARLPEVFDLATGNPSFSDRTVRADDPAGKLRLSLHDYFIARAIERLRPGGLAAFVTSRWTLDKVDQTARAHIASMAELIGSVRLPQGAMNAAAGTDVVVDILFLQKRDAGAEAGGAAWDGLAEAVPAEDGDAALAINRYFVEHPEMVLGDHARTSSAYGPIYTCRAVLTTAGALADLLTQALDRMPRDLFKPMVPATGKTRRLRRSASGPPPRARPSRKAATSFTTAHWPRSSAESRSRSPYAMAKARMASQPNTPKSSAA